MPFVSPVYLILCMEYKGTVWNIPGADPEESVPIPLPTPLPTINERSRSIVSIIAIVAIIDIVAIVAPFSFKHTMDTTAGILAATTSMLLLMYLVGEEDDDDGGVFMVLQCNNKVIFILLQPV